MRVLLLGASGRTGLLTLTEALKRNHTVTALVRRPEAIPTQEGISIITGTPESRSDIVKAFDSAPPTDPIRVVVSTLNNGRTSDNPWAKTTAPKTFLASCANDCLAVMRERGCKKMVFLGTMGVGSSRVNAPWLFNWVVDHSNFKIAFDDHHEAQKVMEAEGEKDAAFAWVDVRAAGLSNGPRKEVKHYGNDGKGLRSFTFISRDSVAAFLLDCVERNDWDRQTPVIAG